MGQGLNTSHWLMQGIQRHTGVICMHSFRTLVALSMAALLCVPAMVQAKKKNKYSRTNIFKAGQKNNKARKAICVEEKRLGKKITKKRIWHEKRYKAPNGEYWDRGQVCETHLTDGRVLFDDGCSGQMPGKLAKELRLAGEQKGLTWGVVFHDACALHDHCYHHNPVTYGYSQEDCDRQMENSMDETCAKRYSKKSRAYRKCRRASKVMYAGLTTLGKKHFHAFNYKQTYLDLYPKSKHITATSGAKCPFRMKKVGAHEGKPLCLSKTKLKKKKCKKRGHQIHKKSYCRITETGYYQLRPLK